jgi:hypothetical protein
MADNTRLNAGTGGDLMATDEVSYSGDTAKVQLVRLVDVAGAEGNKTVSPRLGLTDAELRAAPVAVTGAFWQATQPVSFTWAGLTNAELRAAAVPVSASALPLPAGASTEATLAAVQALLNTIVGTIQNHNGPFVDGSPGQVVLAKRRDSDTTSVADGDLNTLNMDEEGRLKVASKPASYATVTGNVTSASSTVPVNTERFSNLMVHCTGTFAGANCTFEGSLNSTNGTDGAWFAVQAIRSNANTIETATGVLAAAPAYAWELSVNALKWFRIRATAWTSGTQVWTLVPGTYATEPIPGAQVSGTQPVSGTVTANIGTGALAAGANAIGDVGLQVRANATGAASMHHMVSAATTNVAQIKATAGRVLGYCLSNTTASWRYVKLHNVASATAGAAVAMTIGIPPNGKAQCNLAQGIGFATAISRSIVTGSADADATATAVGDVVGDIFFA